MTIDPRHTPTHRPPWRRHSTRALHLSAIYAEVVGLAASFATDSDQAEHLTVAVESLRLALAAELEATQ